MSRLFHILFMALAMFLLPVAAFAQAYDDCRLTCMAERDTRNMSCPSPYDSVNAGEDRRQCLDKSQAIYKECIQRCPALPPPPSSERVTPPVMGY
jgi:hypothetical protein